MTRQVRSGKWQAIPHKESEKQETLRSHVSIGLLNWELRLKETMFPGYAICNGSYHTFPISSQEAMLGT